jgi:hypothetical protein
LCCLLSSALLGGRAHAPPLIAQAHLMREAISGRQRSSKVIKGHQRSSKVISSHQRTARSMSSSMSFSISGAVLVFGDDDCSADDR